MYELWPRHGHAEATNAGAREGPETAALRPFAEADGNRTRQDDRVALVGFEDRGAHQEPRRLPGRRAYPVRGIALGARTSKRVRGAPPHDSLGG